MRIHQNRGSSWSSVAPGGPAQAWAPLIGEPRKGAPRAQLESQLLPTAALLVHVHLEPVSNTLALRQRQSGIRSPSDSEHWGRPASASGWHLPPCTEFLSPALTHLWGPGDSAGHATEDKMWLSPSEPAGALWVLGHPRTAQHPPPAAGHRLLKGTCWAFVSTLRTAAHHWRADEDLAGTDPSSESLRLRDFAPCRQELPASALLQGLVPADTVRYQSNVVDATCPA